MVGGFSLTISPVADCSSSGKPRPRMSAWLPAHFYTP